MSMRRMNIDRRAVRVIPRPVSDFVRARMRLDLRIGHIKMRNIHQLTTTRPGAISRTKGACSAEGTSPLLPRTESFGSGRSDTTKVATKSRGKVQRVNLESDLDTICIEASLYSLVLQRENKLWRVIPPCSCSPRALNNIHTTTPAAQPGTTVSYHAPARLREPHQSMRRCRDATLQSCEAYKVRLRPCSVCRCDVNSALVCVCRSDGPACERG